MIFDGGIELLCMKKRLLELEMLKNSKRKEHRPGGVYNGRIQTRGCHTPNRCLKECSIVGFLFFIDHKNFFADTVHTNRFNT
ncbi:hypothetical protein CBR56_29360 [Bacillus thuringiensis]|nr:hypothetical protein CBR56_29360 [Bacillus thuringiensis]